MPFRSASAATFGVNVLPYPTQFPNRPGETLKNREALILSEDKTEAYVTAFWNQVLNWYFPMGPYSVVPECWVGDRVGKTDVMVFKHLAPQPGSDIPVVKPVLIIECKAPSHFRLGDKAWTDHIRQLETYATASMADWIVSALAIGTKIRFYYWDRAMVRTEAITINRGDELIPPNPVNPFSRLQTGSSTNLDMIEHAACIHHIIMKTRNKAEGYIP